MFCSRSSLVAVKIFCSSWLPLHAELTSSILCFQAERIHHDLLDFLCRCLLGCLDDFLYTSISSSKSILGIVVIMSSSFSSNCPCWTSASVLRCFGTGWLHLSSAQCFSSYFALSRSKSFGLPCLLSAMLFSCLALALLLSCCWLCSCLACCWLCSSRFFSSSLQIFVFFSLSSNPCCFTSSFSPQARSLWFCLRFSPLAP